MKNNLLTILALGGLLFASSCQMDEPDAGTLTGEVDFSITTSIPSGISTYADPAGTGSHNGGAVLLDPDEYTLRYTLEVYDRDGKLAYDETKNAPEGTFEGVTFDVRLLAKVYDFVFWADFVKSDGTEFYDVTNLKNITYNSDVNAQALATDAADAYYKKEEVDLTQSNQALDVTLKRPFGKIRLIATDALNGNNKQTEYPETITINFGNAVIPTAFNAFEGKVIDGNTTDAGTVTFTAQTETTTVNGDEKENVYLLGFHYFFESSAIPSYAMDVTVTSNEGNVIGQRSLSSIPVQENKLTTVIGNFYTNEGSIDVIVEDKFGNEDVKELEDLVFPEAGKVLLTIGDQSNKYETISDALEAIQGESEAIITLAASDYEESIIVPDGGNIRIVGQKGTKVKDLLSDNSGKMTVENIEFYGTASEGQATVTIGDGASGSITLKNCTLAPLDDNTRPLHYYAGSTASLTVEGCTVTSKVAHPFFNPSDKSGKVVLRDNTFNGTSISAEFKNGNDDQNEAYPVIEGNTFMTGPGVEFSYYFADEQPISFSDLNDNTKKYVYSIINNNTFNSESEPNVTIWQNGNEIITVNKNEFKVTDENGIKYASIMDAIGLYQSSDILLPEGTYNEVVNIPGGRDITIKGQTDAYISALANLGSGNVTVENVTFTSGTNGITSENATIYMGLNTGNITLRNCTIDPAEGTESSLRPIIIFPGATGTLLIENCYIDGTGVTNTYLNQASASGNVILRNNIFTGNSISAEFKGSMDGTAAYPIIEGNTFDYETAVEFTYWCNNPSAVKSASELDASTKQYCYDILTKNTFNENVKNKINVWPRDASAGPNNSFSVNDLTLNITDETTGKKYETIGEAILNSPQGAELHLAAGNYNEIINISTPTDITIIGPKNGTTTITAITANAGNVTLENLTINGATNVGETASVYVGTNAEEITVRNCTIAPTANNRPIITAPGAGKIVIEGCTIDATNGINSYFNNAAASGNIIIRNNTIKGKSLSAEFKGSMDGTPAYPIIEGNTFESSPGYEFTYWNNSGVMSYEGLDEATKAFCDGILNNNTFKGDKHIQVTSYKGDQNWDNTFTINQ